MAGYAFIELPIINTGISRTAVDFLTPGTTTLYTVPAGKILIVSGYTGLQYVKTGTITSYTTQVERASDSAILLPNATNVTTVVGTAVWQMVASTSPANRKYVVAGDSVRYNVTASVFVAGATCTGEVILEGYLLNV